MTVAIARNDFEFIRELIRDRAAIVLEDGKEYLLDARLGPIARTHGHGSVSDLVSQLRSRPPDQLLDHVVEAMTTNETSFFRDITPFEVMERQLLPPLLESNRSSKTLRVWCGACSSGQEPYSIAIMLLESFPQLAEWKVEIAATDISPKMVERTRRGTYSQLEVNRGLRAPLLLKYFTRKGVKFEVKPAVRSMVDPRVMNLIGPWTLRGPFDFVFMRNVLIYFDPTTKRRILDRVADVLSPRGYLFLGGAETTVGVHESFERLPHPKASCYRLKGPS